MVAVGVVQYAPIVTCQRMVGRIPGGGGLQGPRGRIHRRGRVRAAGDGAHENSCRASAAEARISRFSAKGRKTSAA